MSMMYTRSYPKDALQYTARKRAARLSPPNTAPSLAQDDPKRRNGGWTCHGWEVELRGCIGSTQAPA